MAQLIDAAVLPEGCYMHKDRVWTCIAASKYDDEGYEIADPAPINSRERDREWRFKDEALADAWAAEIGAEKATRIADCPRRINGWGSSTRADRRMARAGGGVRLSPTQDERLWSGYTCETCGWFELRPQTRDRGRIYCPHCERLGRGKAFTMKQINVVPAARLEAAEAALKAASS